MTANARARLRRAAAWFATVAVAVALAAACCGRDIPLGVSPAIDAADAAGADGGAGE